MTNEKIARTICNGLCALFDSPELLQEPSPKLLAYERRAVEIPLGEEEAKRILSGSEQAPFTRGDLADIRLLHEDTETMAKIDRRDCGVELTSDDKSEHFTATLAEFSQGAGKHWPLEW